MKYAIVGSRDYPNPYHAVKMICDNLIGTGDKIITGGARGVDKAAERYAKANKIPHKIIYPINPENKLHYLFRNVEIVSVADEIIALWDGKSRGTAFIVDYANKRGKDVSIFKPGDFY